MKKTFDKNTEEDKSSMVKDNIKRSRHKVMVAVNFSKNGKPYNNIPCVFTWYIFGKAINYLKSNDLTDIERLHERLESMHRQLVELSHMTSSGIYNTMRIYVLSYMCSFDDVSKVFMEMPVQTFGFIVDIDEDNYKKTTFKVGARQEVGKILCEMCESWKNKTDNNHLTSNP